MTEAGAYRLTDEQVELRDAVRTLARERIAPRAAEVDRNAEFPWDNKELLAAQDILGLPFPTEYGGLGGDLLTCCLAIEALSAACATTGLILAVHELAALPIVTKGTPEQRQRWLPDLAAGRALIAFAITESGAGSDAGSIAMRAVRDGDEYVLDGAKRFISHGSVADLVVVFAVSDPGARRHRNLSCFVVETNRPGFSIGRLEHKMGIRGSPTAELLFDEVRVPASNRLGAEGRGIRDRDEHVRAVPAGNRRPGRRHRPGRPRVRGPLCDRADPVRQANRRAADDPGACWPTWTPRRKRPGSCSTRPAPRSRQAIADAARWASVCKLVAGDTAMRVTTDAVQVLGGYGYLNEFPVERMMRDAKITQLYEGTQQIQRLVVARSLLARS